MINNLFARAHLLTTGFHRWCCAYRGIILNKSRTSPADCCCHQRKHWWLQIFCPLGQKCNQVPPRAPKEKGHPNGCPFSFDRSMYQGIQYYKLTNQRGISMNKKILWITETAVMLALLVTLQAVTKPLGQLVTGSCVNAVLAITVLLDLSFK